MPPRAHHDRRPRRDDPVGRDGEHRGAARRRGRRRARTARDVRRARRARAHLDPGDDGRRRGAGRSRRDLGAQRPGLDRRRPRRAVRRGGDGAHQHALQGRGGGVRAVRLEGGDARARRSASSTPTPSACSRAAETPLPHLRRIVLLEGSASRDGSPEGRRRGALARVRGPGRGGHRRRRVGASAERAADGHERRPVHVRHHRAPQGRRHDPRPDGRGSSASGASSPGSGPATAT